MGAGVNHGAKMRNLTAIFAIASVLFVSGTLTNAEAGSVRGLASFYGYRSKTANGEMMNPSAMTAAHRSRPFGSHVTVTSLSTGRSVTVRINDRGPFVKGRCIDLSNGAARVLGMDGTAKVSLSADAGNEER